MSSAMLLQSFLMYVIVPVWLFAGIADWACHRTSQIELTSGPKESLLHFIQLGTVGLPLMAVLFMEVNAAILLVMAVGVVLHQAAAVVDVRYANATGIRDGSGRVIGASKIARDISDRRRAQEQQHLLLREMNHRVKNLFALITGIVGVNARSAATPAELATTVSEQLMALSRAHALTMSPAALLSNEAQRGTTLHALIEAILTPYDSKTSGAVRRFVISGDNCRLSVTAVTPVALLFHEFATNAAKYGSLTSEKGTVNVSCHQSNEEIIVHWKEAGGPRVTASGTEGFGSRLIEITVRQIGRLKRSWAVDGVMIELALLRSEIEPPTIEDSATRS